MDVSVRVLDDGAWISIGGSREVGVSEIWRLDEHELCGCETADVLLEGFFDARMRGDGVEARPVGRCIACGTQGSLGWLTVGHLDGGEFEAVDPGASHRVTRS
jgi:hypothetical protein